MAKSKAKKMRDKMTREGKRNPELNRSLFVFADMETRKTKTKKEKLQHQQTKHKERLSDGAYSTGDDRFFIAFHTSSKMKKELFDYPSSLCPNIFTVNFHKKTL